MSLLSHSLPSCGISSRRQWHCWSKMEKIVHNHWTAFFSSPPPHPLLFSNLSFFPGHLPLIIFIPLLSARISIICWFSPARGWRGWDAVWRVPSACWHLSSCPAYSPPAPLWRWDKTPASPLATVETWEIHQWVCQVWQWSNLYRLVYWDQVTTFGFEWAWGRIVADICSSKEPKGKWNVLKCLFFYNL